MAVATFPRKWDLLLFLTSTGFSLVGKEKIGCVRARLDGDVELGLLQKNVCRQVTGPSRL